MSVPSFKFIEFDFDFINIPIVQSLPKDPTKKRLTFIIQLQEAVIAICDRTMCSN